MLKANIPAWWPSSPVEGVKRVGETLVFDTDDRSKALAIASAVPRPATKGVQISATKAISGAELDNLKSLAPDLNFETGKVFKFAAANTKKDRDNERFSPEVLTKFAADINDGGRALQWMHNGSKLLGTVFYADFDGSELTQYALIPNAIKLPDQPDYALTQAVEDGMVKFVSVGFRGFLKQEEGRDAAGKAVAEWVWHIDEARPETKQFTEQTELSLVNLGAQYGAQRKGIEKEFEFIQIHKQMSTHAKFAVGEKEFSITAKVDAESVTIGGVEELQGAIKALETEISAQKEAAKTLATEVEAFKSPLVATVMEAQKSQAEALRNTEDELKAMTTERLIGMVDAVKSVELKKDPEPVSKVKKYSWEM